MDGGQCPEYHSKLLFYTTVINLHTLMKMTNFCLVPCGRNQCSWDTDLKSFVRFPSPRCTHLNTTLIIRQNIQSSTRALYKIHGIMEIQTNRFLTTICHSCFAIQIGIRCSRNHLSLVPLTQAILRSGPDLFVYSHVLLFDPFKSGKEQELSHYVNFS